MTIKFNFKQRGPVHYLMRIQVKKTGVLITNDVISEGFPYLSSIKYEITIVCVELLVLTNTSSMSYL